MRFAAEGFSTAMSADGTSLDSSCSRLRQLLCSFMTILAGSVLIGLGAALCCPFTFPYEQAGERDALCVGLSQFVAQEDDTPKDAAPDRNGNAEAACWYWPRLLSVVPGRWRCCCCH